VGQTKSGNVLIFVYLIFEYFIFYKKEQRLFLPAFIKQLSAYLFARADAIKNVLFLPFSSPACACILSNTQYIFYFKHCKTII